MLKAWPTQQIAERWLHEFYTRLSNDPSSLHMLYLDNAEVIYTGQVLSGSSSDEGYLMSGRTEIAGFFSCPAITAKFCGSKVKVDVVHPLSNPLCLNAISLSVKGTLFLPVNTALYESAEYTHFICLSPAPQRFGGQPVNYRVATEFLQIYRKTSTPPPDLLATQQPLPLPPLAPEPPLLAHPPHVVVVAPPPPPPAAPPPPPVVSPAPEAPPPPPPPPQTRRYNDELSLHAVATSTAGSNEMKSMTPTQIMEAVNESLKRSLGETSEGRCSLVLRPSTPVNSLNSNVRTFFFLHFTKIDLVDKLRKAGQLKIGEGITIKLSPIKRKNGSGGPPVRQHANRTSASGSAVSKEPVEASAETMATIQQESAATTKCGGESTRRKSTKFKRPAKL